MAQVSDSLKTDKEILNIIKYKYDGWLQRDKAQHAIGSFILTGFSYKLLSDIKRNQKKNNLKLSVSFSLSLGILKETLDSRKRDNIFSYKDLIADLCGVALAILVFSSE